MLAVGDFIGNYRILAQLSLNPASSLYVAEHTYNNLGPVLLIFCPAVTVATDEERDRFLDEARTGTIQQGGQTIAFQDADVANQHPYLVTAYSDEIQNALQDHMKLIGQILQSTQSQHPNDKHVLFDTFLRTFARSAGTRGSATSASTNQSTDTSKKAYQTINTGNTWSLRSSVWKNVKSGRKPRKWQVGGIAGVTTGLVGRGRQFSLYDHPGCDGNSHHHSGEKRIYPDV